MTKPAREVLYPKRLPQEVAANVGFSPAVRSGEWVFVSALSGVYVENGRICIAEGIRGQAETIVAHLGDILGAAGGTLDDVIDLTILIRPTVGDAEVVELGRVLGKGFRPNRHADTWIRADLVGPKEQLIQVKATALLGR